MLVTLFAALLALGSVLPAWGAQEGDPGRLEVFLVGTAQPRRPVAVEFASISAVGDSGDVHELALQASRVASAEVATAQKSLASGELPAGLYRALRLRLAPASGDESAVDAVLSLDFRIERGRPTVLVVEWQPGLPAAGAFSVRPGTPTVRGLTLYLTDEDADEIIAVNRDTHEVFAKIAVGDRPRGIAVSLLGRRAYVANSGDDSVSVIDTANHEVVDTIPLKGGCSPQDLTLAEEGRRLVVTCPGLNSVAVIDPRTDSYRGDVGLARAPSRIVQSPDGRRVYVLLPEGDQVQAIDLVRLVAGPAAAVDAEPTDLAVDDRDGSVVVAHATTPILTVLSGDLRSKREIHVGIPAHGVAVDGDNRRAYVTGGPHGGVALVNLRAGTIVRRWKTAESGFAAIDPDGRKIFATSGDRGTLIILDRIAGKVIDDEKLGKTTVDLAVIP
jgi:YVTN family beta-propeller protein